LSVKLFTERPMYLRRICAQINQDIGKTDM